MITMLISIAIALSTATAPFEKDTVHTSAGDVEITFIGHASLLFTNEGKTIFIDPFGKLADYSGFPKADIILVTHDHSDHLDTSAIDKIRKEETQVVTTVLGAQKVRGATIMKNGETRTIDGMTIEAVPAYNTRHKRDNGLPFHPKGEGNGYVLTIGETRIYVAGDTDDIPEMSLLKNIDIAFLPMNLPYTMTPQETAAAARLFMPNVLYPYHYGDTDTKTIVQLLKITPEIDVRIRSMK
jgi:L-ascorbate metabolism protein UlaG (beta-lactamase superfamily)